MYSKSGTGGIAEEEEWPKRNNIGSTAEVVFKEWLRRNSQRGIAEREKQRKNNRGGILGVPEEE